MSTLEEAKDELINRLNTEISELGREAYKKDSNLTHLHDFLVGKLDRKINDPKTKFGLTDDSIKMLPKLRNSKNKGDKYKNLIGFLTFDPWEFAKLYMYVDTANKYRSRRDFHKYPENFLDEVFKLMQQFIDTFQSFFDSFNRDEFCVVYTLILNLLHEKMFMGESCYDIFTEEEIIEIINFIKSQDFKVKELDRICDKYSDKVLFVKNDGHTFKVSFAIRLIMKTRNRGGFVELFNSLEQEQEHFNNGEISKKIRWIALKLKYLEFEFKELLNISVRNAQIENERREEKKQRPLTEDDIKKKYNEIINAPGSFYDTDSIVAEFLRLKKEISDYCDNINLEKNDRDAKIAIYSRVLSLIEKIGESYIDDTTCRALLKGITDEEIILLIKSWIKMHNDRLQEELNTSYTELCSSGKKDFMLLFSKYNLPLDEKLLKRLELIGYDDVFKILELIKDKKYSASEITYIFENSNLETVKQINGFIKNGSISLDCLKRNINLYDTKNNLLDTYNNMLDYLKMFSINPSIFSDNIELLLYHCNIVITNISLLNKYRLLDSFKKDSNNCLRLLLDKDLVSKIDRLIECGCYEYLCNNLNVLYLPIVRFKRIDVMSSINMPIKSSRDDKDGLYDIDSLLNGDFFISDRELEKYIIYPTIQDNSDIQIDLNQYIRGKSPVAKVGNIYISYPKVEREMKDGKSFMEAVFHGRCCSDDTYSSLLEEIKSYVKRK